LQVKQTNKFIHWITPNQPIKNPQTPQNQKAKNNVTSNRGEKRSINRGAENIQIGAGEGMVRNAHAFATSQACYVFRVLERAERRGTLWPRGSDGNGGTGAMIGGGGDEAKRAASP
jgi:hypothetical protein